MRTVLVDLEAYLLTAIQSFEDDPADSDYQEGYEDALKETLRYLREGMRA